MDLKVKENSNNKVVARGWCWGVKVLWENGKEKLYLTRDEDINWLEEEFPLTSRCFRLKHPITNKYTHLSCATIASIEVVKVRLRNSSQSDEVPSTIDPDNEMARDEELYDDPLN